MVLFVRKKIYIYIYTVSGKKGTPTDIASGSFFPDTIAFSADIVEAGNAYMPADELTIALHGGVHKEREVRKLTIQRQSIAVVFIFIISINIYIYIYIYIYI